MLVDLLNFHFESVIPYSLMGLFLYSIFPSSHTHPLSSIQQLKCCSKALFDLSTINFLRKTVRDTPEECDVLNVNQQLTSSSSYDSLRKIRLLYLEMREI